MMYEFLSEHRAELERRCRAKVTLRPNRAATPRQLDNGIPMFLDQLIRTLEQEKRNRPVPDGAAPRIAHPGADASAEFDFSSTQHGLDLLDLGYTVDQVVHDYGDLCQAASELAIDCDVTFAVAEFKTLNLCLDNAVASAVLAYNRERDLMLGDQQLSATNERLGCFAHELRNHLGTATLAVTAIKAGNVGLSGATGAVLDRSLVALRNLIDRSLTEVRIGAGMTMQRRVFALNNFIGEVKYSAQLEAQINGCALMVEPVDPQLFINADRDLLFSALGNLLQNAFKFSDNGAQVTLRGYLVGERIRIDVEDNGGGLPEGFSVAAFEPFTQAATNRHGLGLGLSIAQRSVEANDGRLSVVSVKGRGCVFTIDLPRCAPSSAS
nr:HAMP domain-containing sensor histidine kinase [Rugamonas sp.]